MVLISGIHKFQVRILGLVNFIMIFDWLGICNNQSNDKNIINSDVNPFTQPERVYNLKKNFKTFTEKISGCMHSFVFIIHL